MQGYKEMAVAGYVGRIVDTAGGFRGGMRKHNGDLGDMESGGYIRGEKIPFASRLFVTCIRFTWVVHT